MKKIILMLLISSFSFSQESEKHTYSSDNKATEATNTEAAPAEEKEPAQGTKEDAKPQLEEIKCQNIFLEYLKTQKQSVQDENLKVYFALDYATKDEFIGNLENEFKWKTKQIEYKDTFKSLLKSSTNYKLMTNVQFGKYDFKKKRFPFTFMIEKKNILSYYSHGMTIGGSHYTLPSRSCDSVTFAKNQLDSAEVKVSNLKKEYFLNIDEDLAEKFTKALGSFREVDANVTYVPKNTKGILKPDIYDKKKKKLKLEVSGIVTEVEFKFFQNEELEGISTDLNY